MIIEEERYRSRIRTAVQQLEVQIERGKLTKEIIDTMIDTVYVYDKKRIEVILRFDDVLEGDLRIYGRGEGCMTFKNFMYKGVLMIAVLALIGWLGKYLYLVDEKLTGSG